MGKNCCRGLETMWKGSGSKNRTPPRLFWNSQNCFLWLPSSHLLGEGRSEVERGFGEIKGEDENLLHHRTGRRTERRGGWPSQKKWIYPGHFGQEDIEVWNGKPLSRQHPSIRMGRYWIKKGANSPLEWPPDKKGGVWREVSKLPFFPNCRQTPCKSYIPEAVYTFFGIPQYELSDSLSFYRR